MTAPARRADASKAHSPRGCSMAAAPRAIAAVAVLAACLCSTAHAVSELIDPASDPGLLKVAALEAELATTAPAPPAAQAGCTPLGTQCAGRLRPGHSGSQGPCSVSESAEAAGYSMRSLSTPASSGRLHRLSTADGSGSPDGAGSAAAATVRDEGQPDAAFRLAGMPLPPLHTALTVLLSSHQGGAAGCDPRLTRSQFGANFPGSGVRPAPEAPAAPGNLVQSPSWLSPDYVAQLHCVSWTWLSLFAASQEVA